MAVAGTGLSLCAPRVEARRLTFHPDGAQGRPVLRDVTFRVDPGEALLVAGGTGTGKSTLLRLIAGLGGLDPDPHAAGELQVVFPDDAPRVPPVDPSSREASGAHAGLPQARPGRVVLVPQSPRDALVNLDVLSALALPLEEQGIAPREAVSRVEHALEQMGLLAKVHAEVARLSMGEARRVALAGAWAQDAGLLLLDEPFADLDPLGIRSLQADLRRLTGRCTLVVAEHRPGLLQGLMDKTLHLLGPPYKAQRAWPVGPSTSEPPVTLGVRDLSVRRGDRCLIKGAGFRLGPGVWGLLGPNGAGKTSLLETLAGLVPPDSGFVEVDGVPVWQGDRRVKPRRGNERALRGRLQVAFQEPREAFFASSVLQELAVALQVQGAGRTEAHSVVRQAMVRAGREGLVSMSPRRLSGGEARVVQLMGTLLGAPRVLFLDEPTHGLDVGLRRDLAFLLRELEKRGHLVVVATHEPGFLPAGSNWLFLPGDGRLLTGSQGAPGAPEPSLAGFDKGLRETGADADSLAVGGDGSEGAR